MNSSHLKQAITSLNNGGVIAYPTEAVFGLGCVPLFQDAVYRILQLKNRSVEKGLILVASSIEQLEDYVYFDSLPTLDQIRDSWPGPVTWLIPAKKKTPIWLTGSHKTLAVRVSAHPIVNALCRELGPIVSTSANPAGSKPAVTTQEVLSYFGDGLDYVIPADIKNNLSPTEIRDAQNGNIIRVS
ncbi:MAG: threonylcarbamoyl-AMP synthase [marine bacterium B5-7]|nr:MAG: threonylcarbamoyl-AMP synthase [marine bacterium B5-7]